MSAPGPAATARPDAPRGGPSRSVIAAVVAVLAVVAVVVAIVIGRAASTSPEPTSSATPSASASAQADPGKAVPTGATGFGGPLVVNPGAPANVPTLEVFEDPQCPICKQFEAAYGPTIAAMVKANQVKHVVHTMSFLDLNLRNDSSKRAANAAFCAADQGKFARVHAGGVCRSARHRGPGLDRRAADGFATAVGITGSAWTPGSPASPPAPTSPTWRPWRRTPRRPGSTRRRRSSSTARSVTNVTPDGLVAAVKAATR